MPAYTSFTTQLANPTQQVVPGLPTYVFGGLNTNVAPMKMRVTAVQLTSPNAVVTGTIIEGQIPIVGQKVTITGAVPSYFNVSNTSITAVTSPAVPDIGVYSITFTLTNSNIPTTASPGLAVAPQAETSETIVNGASSAVAIQSNTIPTSGRVIRADVGFPTIPAAATVDIQTAAVDIDSEYQFYFNVVVITGGVLNPGGSGGSLSVASVITPPTTAPFARLFVSGVGGVGKIVGKFSV